MRVLGLTVLALGGLALVTAPAEARKCKQDAVRVGAACIDKYEASVWETTDLGTIKDIQKGKVQTVADLSLATQRGAASDDYGVGCPDTAAGCMTLYAVSMPAVTPSAYITWFQAAAACANANKRLATNQEWQVAAYGTPDPGTDNGTSDCNVGNTFTVAATGSRSLCVSNRGAFDMVGNLNEWVADWGDLATNCTNWSPTYGTDFSCVGGDGSVNLPGALIRGGYFGNGAFAGVFAVSGGGPSSSATSGFAARASLNFWPFGHLIVGNPAGGRA